MISPSQRTIKYFKERGYYIEPVERYIAPLGIRKDLFGIIDFIAIKQGEIIGVQSTGQAFAAHNRKILSSPIALLWLQSGAELVLIGWRKVKQKRGGKRMIWKPKLKRYKEEDFKK